MIPKNTYVGRRYIPKHCGDWDNSKNTIYESLSVVLWQGASYTSKQDVPKGIDIGNILYWVKSADYNAQVAIYEQNVRDYHAFVLEQIGIIEEDNNTFKTEQQNNYNNFTQEQQNNYDTFITSQGNVYQAFIKTVARYYDNVALMLTDTNITKNMNVATLGFYNINDGGSSIYHIREKNTSEVANGFTTFDINGFIAELVQTNSINIRQLGAKERDGGTSNINTILQYAVDNFNDVFIPTGNFDITTTINITKTGTKLHGDIGSKIYAIGAINAFNINGTRIYIDNIEIFYGYGAGVGIQLGKDTITSEIRITNMHIISSDIGILTGQSGFKTSNVIIKDCVIHGFTTAGIQFALCNDIYCSKNIITGNNAGTESGVIIKNNVQAITMDSCSFFACGYGIYSTFTGTITGTTRAEIVGNLIGNVPSYNSFINCYFDSNLSAGVYLNHSMGYTFSGCWFSNRPKFGVQILGYSSGNKFSNCAFQNNGCGIIIYQNSLHTNITNCSFVNNGNVGTNTEIPSCAIAFQNAEFVTVNGCNINNDQLGMHSYDSAVQAYGIWALATSNNLVITNNLIKVTTIAIRGLDSVVNIVNANNLTSVG